ncbi:APC family permease [Thermoplasmatales archaeon AK]|nr:APC family permease [Thermoplasmatales archaeon AK]
MRGRITLEARLRKDSIGFIESAFQGIAGSAPAGAAVATLTGAAAFALGSLPLTALVAFVVVLLNAYIIKRLSRQVASAGGYYEYVKRGIGPKSAFFTGLFYIFYQTMALSFIALSVAVFVPAMLGDAFGINIPAIYFYPLLLGTLGFGFLISYLGIRISTRFTLVMAFLEILFVSVFGIYILLSHTSINTVSVFTPHYALNGFDGVGLGVLLMYTAFSGFGASTPLGEEVKNPRKSIGNSVVTTVLVLGLFFVFTSYYFTVAWGPANMQGYAQALVPGIEIMNSYLGPVAAVIVSILFVNSLLTGTVVVTNSTSRVMMAMGRDGIIHTGFSKVSSKHRTPHYSAGFVVAIAAAIGIVSNLILGGFLAFILTATAATLGVLFVHSVINASLPGLEKLHLRRITPSSVALSVITIVIFGLIFYSTFLSVNLAVIVGALLFGVYFVISLIYTAASRGRISALGLMDQKNIEETAN